jgi:hypothetical protein
MFKEALEFFQKEWSTIKNAPWTFILALSVVLVPIYLALSWRYDGIVQQLKEQIQALRENVDVLKGRILAKDDQLVSKDSLLQEYRQRLHLTEKISTSYSLLTNEELRIKSLELVERLRQEIRLHVLECQRIPWEYHEKIRETLIKRDKDEEARLYNEQQRLLNDSYVRFMSDYNEKFKVNAVLLRDEMLIRLPKKYSKL